MKAQLCRLKTLMREEAGTLDTREHRRHFNRLLLQYRHLRAGRGFDNPPGTVVLHYPNGEQKTVNLQVQRLDSRQATEIPQLSSLVSADKERKLLFLAKFQKKLYVGIQTSQNEGHIYMPPPPPGSTSGAQ